MITFKLKYKLRTKRFLCNFKKLNIFYDESDIGAVKIRQKAYLMEI